MSEQIHSTANDDVRTWKQAPITIEITKGRGKIIDKERLSHATNIASLSLESVGLWFDHNTHHDGIVQYSFQIV